MKRYICSSNNIDPEYATQCGHPELIGLNKCNGTMKLIERDKCWVTRKCNKCGRLSGGIEFKFK